MAEFISFEVDGVLKVDNILSYGIKVLESNYFDSDSYFLRQIQVQYDSNTYTTNATSMSFKQIPTANWNPFLQTCLGGSIIKLTYFVPARAPVYNWGGLYIEPQVRLDGVAWYSLGSCGYDGGVMINDTQSIASFTTSILFDPLDTLSGLGQPIPFNCDVRFMMAPYSATSITINGSHAINSISGTHTLHPGTTGQQHYMHLIMEEYAKIN